MNYLEQVLEATKRNNANARASRNNLANLANMVQTQQLLAQKAATPRAVTSASAPRSGGGKAPSGGGGGSDELWNRLQRMLKDRPSIKPGNRSRSYEEQVRLWNLYKAGKGALAARPGSGKHPSGLANDLKYSNDADREWAFANAKNYGLAFPLYNPKLGRGRDEGWHIELAR